MAGGHRSLGCGRCRLRKVRCDLARPKCGACERRDETCGDWPDPKHFTAVTSSVVPQEQWQGQVVHFPDRPKKKSTRKPKVSPPLRELVPKAAATTSVVAVYHEQQQSNQPQDEHPSEKHPQDEQEVDNQFAGPTWASIFQLQQSIMSRQAPQGKQNTLALMGCLWSIYQPDPLRQAPRAFLEHLNMIDAKTQMIQSWHDVLNVPIVDAAVRALALVSLGNVKNNDPLLKQGMQLYGTVLQAHRRSFANLDAKKVAKDFNVLVATTFMSAMTELIGSHDYANAGYHWVGMGALLQLVSHNKQVPAHFETMMWEYRRMSMWDRFRERKPDFWCTEGWRYLRVRSANGDSNQLQLLIDDTLIVPHIMLAIDNLEARSKSRPSPRSLISTTDSDSTSEPADPAPIPLQKLIAQTVRCQKQTETVLRNYILWYQRNVPTRNWTPSKWKGVGECTHFHEYVDMNQSVPTMYQATFRVVVLGLLAQIKTHLLCLLQRADSTASSHSTELRRKILEREISEHESEILVWAEDSLLSLEFLFGEGIGYSALVFGLFPLWYGKYAVEEAARKSNKGKTLLAKWTPWFGTVSEKLNERGYPS